MPSKPSKPSSDAGLQGNRVPQSAASDCGPRLQTICQTAETPASTSAAGFLIEIHNVQSCPVYVWQLRRGTKFSITSDQAKAKVFPAQDAATLSAVSAEVASWPLNPGPVYYVSKGI